MDSDAELFMKYDYPEAKDLCKHFLTTVVAVLVFSLTFAEKIIDFKTATPLAKYSLLGGWCAFMLAIILSGIGLAYITVAAGRIVYQERTDPLHVPTVTLGWMSTAGGFFVLGLCLFLVAVASSAFQMKSAKKLAMQQNLSELIYSHNGRSCGITDSEILEFSLVAIMGRGQSHVCQRDDVI
jgi:hypothetical protein